MKKTTLLLAATMLSFALPACSGKSDEPSAAVETKTLPIIDIVATHAVVLDISVAKLTFVPNSVAPWLGRIILLDDDGHLYSTDIEGRDPKPIGTGKYIDIFGLAREAAPGVFLAINTDNNIEAFIEADNDGNFSPMVYSGETVKARAFCAQKQPAESQISFLTSYGEYMTLGLNISDNHLSQEILSARPNPRKPNVCKFGFPAISLGSRDFAIQKGDISSLFISYSPPMRPNQKLPVLESYRANINNGLSVRGLEHVKFIATTQSNYGGGAYADGVLALVDRDESRIVFISLSYAERKLSEAANPPKSTPQ
ncbi:MAG: hypothetical protein L3J65_08780 [Robiginitomaculum sp.]|nr:hypothetical protein [Robiginitomaculum sp.]